MELMFHYIFDRFDIDRCLVQNAQHFESNTALCRVSTGDASYIVRSALSSSCPFIWVKRFSYLTKFYKIFQVLCKRFSFGSQ